MMQPLVLVADDEKSIRSFLKVSLETQGYKCIEADCGTNTLMLTTSCNPDILILDLGLPDIDGVDVIKQLRKVSQIPILIVSARGHDREKVEALDAGADDYLTKPFSVSELLARIRVILRRQSILGSSEIQQESTFKIGDLTVDANKRRVWLATEEIHLTPNEYKVLALLIKHQGKVLTHKFIIESIWGSMIADDTQSLRVCMGNIRRKLKEDPAQPRYIITEIGVGYRLADD
ncbi:MAG: response regulator transcription factor [Acidaminococcaceae bacterium]|nr:response regulator transcription factor [Acidaminococcaceae bacterium]